MPSTNRRARTSRTARTPRRTRRRGLRLAPQIGTVLAVIGTTVAVGRALRRVKTSSTRPFLAPVPPVSSVASSLPDASLSSVPSVTPLSPVSSQADQRSGPLRLTVGERIVEADGVVRLRLDGGGGPLPGWEPGAHLDVVLPSGAIRQYSLCGDPADTGSYTIAARLIEDGRGGSRELHERLHEGTVVEVRGPRNRFRLEECHAYVFIAGGIGITPILPMVRQAESEGVPWRLVYGGRSRASMPFLAEVEKLAGAGADRVTIVPEDEDGLPDLAAALADAPPHSAVYCCGPGPLMDAVAALLPEGLALHTERFTPAGPATVEPAPVGPASAEPAAVVPEDAGEDGPSATSGEDGPSETVASEAAASETAVSETAASETAASEAAVEASSANAGTIADAERDVTANAGEDTASEAPGGDTPFEVELRRTGRTVTVPADTSVLAAIREQALPNVPYSCEEGFCGTCQQRVLAGEVDHRDDLLTDDEREDSLLICVSRARGERLVLDL
ncbi:PDR/VanB family oxidoreductase [Streptomyces sp. NPDC003077]|uniref:PDR/VanB family oxidoreductase n=1 Tax=Streptomyces sp. NPDC003077 TaxID=3154443 RepID=UPI0033A889A5